MDLVECVDAHSLAPNGRKVGLGLMPSIKERILRARGAYSLRLAGGTATFESDEHEMAAFHAVIRPSAAEPQEWSGTFFIRKRRDSKDWSAAEIYWSSHLHAPSEFERAPGNPWCPLLQGEFRDDEYEIQRL
jgi:hypothetical protein